MFGEKSLKTNMMAGQWSQNVSEESSLVRMSRVPY